MRLWIIGNGFDLFHGLHTRYLDYKACSYSGNNNFTFSLNGSQKLNKYYTKATGTDFSGTETCEITDAGGATFQWTYSVGSTSSNESYYDWLFVHDCGYSFAA